MIRSGIGKRFGLVFLLGAVWIAVSGASIFAQQLDERDWRVAMAEVIDVDQREESRRGRRSRMVTVYDVQYAYYPNGVQYTGELVGSLVAYTQGDRFDIKYDPDAPENSTTILEPSPGALAVNLAAACVFALIGLLATGIWKRRKIESDDPPGV